MFNWKNLTPEIDMMQSAWEKTCPYVGVFWNFEDTQVVSQTHTTV